MKLDYKHDINEYGDNMVRLFDFDKAQAIRFREELERSILKNKAELDLATLDFIEPVNCNLVLRISDEDLGIYTEDEENFFCDLTMEAYKQMILFIEPFCLKESKAYRMLYEVDSPTDFLFAPAGM